RRADLETVGLADDFGGLLCACERTGREERDVRNERSKSLRAELHLGASLLGQRSEVVGLTRTGERVAILREAVANEQQVHDWPHSSSGGAMKRIRGILLTLASLALVPLPAASQSPRLASDPATGELGGGSGREPMVRVGFGGGVTVPV